MKRFEHEWIFEPFLEHPTFVTKRMFGGLAAYLFERMLMILVEPTKSGRWDWHGVLICTGYEHQTSIQAEFAAVKPHAVLRKWLFIDSADEEFESTMTAIAQRMLNKDPRFGIVPNQRKPRRAVSSR